MALPFSSNDLTLLRGRHRSACPALTAVRSSLLQHRVVGSCMGLTAADDLSREGVGACHLDGQPSLCLSFIPLRLELVTLSVHAELSFRPHPH